MAVGGGGGGGGDTGVGGAGDVPPPPPPPHAARTDPPAKRAAAVTIFVSLDDDIRAGLHALGLTSPSTILGPQNRRGLQPHSFLFTANLNLS